MTVTELVTFDLRSGHDVTSEGSEANKLLKYILESVTAQPGSEGAFHGVQKENADKLDIAFGKSL